MSFYTTRSKNFASKIQNQINSRKPLIGYAIVFKAGEKDPYVYQFKDNFCQLSSLSKISWSYPTLITDLPWEDLVQIQHSIKFVPESTFYQSLRMAQISPFIFAKTKVHRLFNKITEKV